MKSKGDPTGESFTLNLHNRVKLEIGSMLIEKKKMKVDYIPDPRHQVNPKEG